MRQWTILLVELDSVLGRALKVRLLCHGNVEEFASPVGLLENLSQRNVDLLILGCSNGHASEALKSVHALRKNHKHLPVIFLASESSEDLAIDAIRSGVNDYFKSPFNLDEIAASVNQILLSLASVTTSKPNRISPEDCLVGSSRAMQNVKNCISQVAATMSNVLLTGETGTGKELVAQSIHKKSPRADKPFICINCAAVPDALMESEFFGYERGAFTGAHSNRQGKLALANGGTVFFDEIGDMTPYMQAKILRAIEGKEIQPLGRGSNISVDFRVIAATNHDLDRLAAEGKFRPDLYFRLNVGRIHLPPLRERKEDIPALIDYYIGDLNLRFGRHIERLVEGVMDLLLRYSWPGNIRELRNVLEAAYVQNPSEQACTLCIPDTFGKCLLSTPDVAPQNERDHLVTTLAATNWNKSATAQKLHWSRMTLYRKLAKYEITENTKFSQ